MVNFHSKLKALKPYHLIVVTAILCGCLFIRCDCCITCPDGTIRAWLISPEDGATVNTPMVTLVWGAEFINTIRNEQIHLRVFSETVTYRESHYLPMNDRSYRIGPLEPATTYHWRISPFGEVWWDHRRVSLDVDDIHTDTWTFTTADVLWEPGHVHSPTPDSGAAGVSVNPSFAWEVYNPELLPFDFNIYLGQTTDPPLLASGLGAPSYDLSADTLEYSTQYNWRVEAYYATDTIEGPLWTFTTGFLPEDEIFALLEIDARQAPSGHHVREEIRARFDSAVAPVAPIKPLQADSVYCETVRIPWIDAAASYGFTEESFPFIENGELADFTVYGNSSVPNLNVGILFPACTLDITSPLSFETVSIDGFEVTWNSNVCGGNVWLTLMQMNGIDSTGVWKEAVNDGLDSLSAADLAPLGGQTGTYNLIILRQVEESIDASGYRSESLIRARAYNVMEQINIFGD